MAISSPKHEKKPRKKKPRFPGLSCVRRGRAESATLSLGNAASAAWINGFAHNHAENDPPDRLESAPARLSLAHNWRAQMNTRSRREPSPGRTPLQMLFRQEPFDAARPNDSWARVRRRSRRAEQIRLDPLQDLGCLFTLLNVGTVLLELACARSSSALRRSISARSGSFRVTNTRLPCRGAAQLRHAELPTDGAAPTASPPAEPPCSIHLSAC